MASGSDGVRQRLNKDGVLDAAVRFADEVGIDALTMRALAEHLGVVPMALYKHVTNKRDLLDEMVDRVWGEVTEPRSGRGWKPAMRDRSLSLRGAMTRHRWAVGLMEAHGQPGPENLRQHNAMMGCLRESGFSFRTTVHVTSMLDAYVYGFALQQKTLSFETPEESAQVAAATQEAQAAQGAALAELYPYLVEVVVELGKRGYDYDAEFETGLDLLLDGVDQLRGAWRAAPEARS